MSSRRFERPSPSDYVMVGEEQVLARTERQMIGWCLITMPPPGKAPAADDGCVPPQPIPSLSDPET